MEKIGIIDSGIGGITVLRSLLKLLPNENYIYVGDNENSPYGDKNHEELYKYTKRMVNYLIKQKVTIIVFACNTICCTVLNELEKEYTNIKFFGVINGTVKKVIENKPKELLIIGTKFTINSNVYEELIKEFMPNVKIISLETPLLVPQIEMGNQKMEQMLLKYLKIYKNIDTILLGCTHYKLLESKIKSITKSKIIASSDCVADDVYKYFKINNLFSHNRQVKIYTTGSVEKFYNISSKILSDKVYKLKLR